MPTHRLVCPVCGHETGNLDLTDIVYHYDGDYGVAFCNGCDMELFWLFSVQDASEVVLSPGANQDRSRNYAR